MVTEFIQVWVDVQMEPERSEEGESELSSGDLARAIPPTPNLDVVASDHLAQ